MADINAVHRLRLLEAWDQVQRHMHHLQYALSQLVQYLPVSSTELKVMSDDVVQDWDQFILRFSKLQDAIGAKLFPAILTYLEESFDDKPMLDKLHRLEKLGYLSTVSEWQSLRVIRNQFSHDYPQDDELKASYLNQAVNKVVFFQQLIDRIQPLIDLCNQGG
jgi:hypothetical protein